MSKIQFYINDVNSVAIEIAYDVHVLSGWWMEVYPVCFKQWKSLLIMPQLNDININFKSPLR